jgi:rhodanese-related sulfurtransferase
MLKIKGEINYQAFLSQEITLKISQKNFMQIFYALMITLSVIMVSWKQSFAQYPKNIFIEPASIPKNAMIIDIRKNQATRIPGALCISMHALKNKSFLKNKTIIIIHEGYGCKHIIQAINSLINDGFQNIHLLKGGINAWALSGRRIEGDAFQIKHLNRISPRFVFEDMNNIQIIEICETNNSLLNAHIPQVMILPARSQTLIQEINAAIEKADNSFYSVITSDQTHWYEWIEKKLLDSRKCNVFFLKGGTKNYADFIHKQHMIWDHKGKVKINGPCRKCNQ